MMSIAPVDTIADVGVFGEHLVLERVSWDFYEMLLGQTIRRPLRITYDRGRLELMSPLPKHEHLKKLLSSMVSLISLDRDIPVGQFGSTTFRRKTLERGIEPDECFYIQREALVRGREDFDFEVDPAPDLAIEVDVTNWSLDRLPIYAAFGVPEIWRYDGRRMVCLHLQSDDTYQPMEKSLAFPFLPVGELDRFLADRHTSGDMALLQNFRRWLRTLR